MQRILVLLLCSLISLATSDNTRLADCFKCWETLCNPDVPYSQECDCDCLEYVPGGDICTDYVKIVPDTDTCCMEANQYLETEIDSSLTPVSFIGEQCSLRYNQPVDGNVPLSTSSILPKGNLFIIDAIEFECESCIQSVSLYLNKSTNVGANTQFTLSIWRPYTPAQSPSIVFVAQDSFPLLSFDSQPMPWNNIYRAEATVNGGLCFKPGDRLGVNIPNSFDGKILRPQFSDGVAYMRSFSECHMLNNFFFTQAANGFPVPLIDVTIVSPETSTVLTSTFNEPSTSALTSSTHSSTLTMMAPSASNGATDAGDSSPSESPSIYIPVAIVGVVVVVIVVLVCGSVLLAIVIMKKRQAGHSAVKDEQSVEMRPGQPHVRPGESRGSFNFAEEWHQGSPAVIHANAHNAFNSNVWDDRTGSAHHYDDPNELNTVPPRNNEYGSSDQQYTCMELPDSGVPSNATSPSQTLSSPNYNPSHAGNRPPSRNGHYQSPRTPASSSMSSDYDSRSPLVLDKFNTSRQTSSGTPDHPLQQHLYHRLENPNEASEQSPPIPPRSSSISRHEYQVLESETGKEHLYHVMEKGLQVPGANDRLSWAHQNLQVSGANFYPQLFRQYQGMQFFDERDHYWEPADKPSHIYDQLKNNRCREIPLSSLEFEDEIGSGHFGVVYKGTWKLSEDDQRAVAIKTLKPEAANEEQKSRLLKEGARMMQFFHSNVVTLHGMVTVNEMPMLVIEYMTNHDLLTFLQQAKKKKKIPEASSLLRFGRDIAAGMRHLAKKKFVHRDLAARNILLNESLVCKISDFGMTRDDIYRYKMDTPEHIPLRWTPLEAVNERKYSEKSDVYSYGMVLFEIWSLGQKPLTTMSDRDTIINFIEQGGVCFPPPGCPREIYRLMIRCWHPDPIKRPPFGDILEDFLSTSDESLLHWSTQDKRSSPKAFEIGASIKEGFNLYVDLQKIYREQ